MASLQVAVTVLVLIIGLTQAAPSTKTLPLGLYTCPANDPDLNECFVRNANVAIPALAPGVPSLKLIKFEPLHVEEFRLNDSGSNRQMALDLTLKNADFIGLGGMKITKARVDLKGNSIYYEGVVPRLEIIGGYTISGRILILPIVGEGAINITLVDITFSMKLDLDHEVKNGVEMLKAKDSKLDFKTEFAMFNLENLFNGDKALGDNMNLFLNENWRDLVADLGPPISDVVNMAKFNIFSRLFSVFPLNQIFTS